MKRKDKPGEGSGSTAQASSHTKLFHGMPHLVEHLNVRQYEDGGMRQTGRIILDVIGSMWRVIVKDADSGMQLVVYMPSIDDALLQAELLLGADETPWEADPYAKLKPSPKSKK